MLINYVANYFPFRLKIFVQLRLEFVALWLFSCLSRSSLCCRKEFLHVLGGRKKTFCFTSLLVVYRHSIAPPSCSLTARKLSAVFENSSCIRLGQLQPIPVPRTHSINLSNIIVNYNSVRQNKT